jgi:hypothetical protein
MRIVETPLAYARFLTGYALAVRKFMSSGPITLDQARALIATEMAGREKTFLSILEKYVYAVSDSPYRRLLDHAGIAFSDVERLVSQVGLEGTLERLYDAGVYVTQDEFKGRKPIVRNGLEFEVSDTDFQHELETKDGYISKQTSGTTGPSSAVRVNFDYLQEQAVSLRATPNAEAFCSGRPVALWWTGDLSNVLYIIKGGLNPEVYFSTRNLSWRPSQAKATFLTDYSWLICRLSGHPVPRPEFVPLNRADVVAEWLAVKVKQGTPGVLHAFASPAVRACIAARDKGLDISGSVISVSGEPLTPAKARILEDAGVTIFNRYGTQDTGQIGYSCGNPAQPEEMHVLKNRMAVIERQKTLPDGARLQGVVVTSLTRHSSKLAINLETGDFATFSERNCGCMLEELGLTTHISGVLSYEKLTSDSVTFVGERLIQLIEQDLPSRFGGTVGDYQVVEEEEGGITRVSLLIAPRLGEVSEDEAKGMLMDTLSASDRTGAFWTDLWRQGGTLRVVRREPYRSGTTKVMPLHFQRESGSTVAAKDRNSLLSDGNGQETGRQNAHPQQ